MLGRVARTARWLGSLAVLAALPGCRCSDPNPGAVGEDAHAVACRSACAAYFGADCRTRSGSHSDRAECQDSCEKRSALSERAGCGASRRTFLDCVSRATLSCEAVTTSPAVALEQAEGAAACRPALEALARCDAPCRDPGTTHLGESEDRRTFVELVRNGCEGCPEKLTGGAGEGAPCQAARVCAQHCCGCGEGPASYLVRACLEGHCAEREAACRAAPLISELRPCER
jgi:hypothetical protein